MKYKASVSNTYPLIAFLNDKTIDKINAIFGTQYVRQSVNQITIKRKEKSFGFWNKLIREVPGFEKGKNEKE